MITLKQFDGGAVSPRDDAILYNAIIKNSGVFSGMEITHLGANQVLIKEGRGIIKGRVWEHSEETIYCSLASAGEMKGRLFLHMDLSNLEEPLKIKSTVANALPALIQEENCNYTNGIYEIELCTYDVDDIHISNLQVTYPELTDVFPIAKTKEETLAATKDDVLASAQVVGGLISDLDAQKIYSTNETAIGKWIDGRTIYRKCYYIPGDITAEYTIIDSAFKDTYEILKMYGGCFDPLDGGGNAIPTVSIGTSVFHRALGYNKYRGGVFLALGSNMQNRTQNANIIVEYIKPE